MGHTIAEVSCPTKYFAEASSINLRRSIKYGFGCLATAMEYRMAHEGLIKSKRFPAELKDSAVRATPPRATGAAATIRSLAA